MSIRDLMKVTKRVFNTRETPEGREDRIKKKKKNQKLQAAFVHFIEGAVSRLTTAHALALRGYRPLFG